MTEEVVNETEKNVGDEKPVVEEEAPDSNKENPSNEAEEKEPEDKVSSNFVSNILFLKNLFILSSFLFFF